MCKAFTCVPSVAEAELKRDPLLVVYVMEAMNMCDVHQAMKMNPTPEKPSKAMLQYMALEGEIMLRGRRKP